jgi:hypothetical protein
MRILGLLKLFNCNTVALYVNIKGPVFAGVFPSIHWRVHLSENAIRPFVVGRKNWQFYKSPGGAETACILYSVIETAKLNGHNPSKYLKTLFERIPYAVSPDDWIALLPWNISL